MVFLVYNICLPIFVLCVPYYFSMFPRYDGPVLGRFIFNYVHSNLKTNLSSLGFTWSLKEPGETWRNQEKPGGTKRNLEEPGRHGVTWRNLEEPGGATWRNLEELEEPGGIKYKQLKQSKLNILHMRARKQVIFKHALGQHGEHKLICCFAFQSLLVHTAMGGRQVDALKKH